MSAREHMQETLAALEAELFSVEIDLGMARNNTLAEQLEMETQRLQSEIDALNIKLNAGAA